MLRRTRRTPSSPAIPAALQRGQAVDGEPAQPGQLVGAALRPGCRRPGRPAPPAPAARRCTPSRATAGRPRRREVGDGPAEHDREERRLGRAKARYAQPGSATSRSGSPRRRACRAGPAPQAGAASRPKPSPVTGRPAAPGLPAEQRVDRAASSRRPRPRSGAATAAVRALTPASSRAAASEHGPPALLAVLAGRRRDGSHPPVHGLDNGCHNSCYTRSADTTEGPRMTATPTPPRTLLDPPAEGSPAHAWKVLAVITPLPSTSSSSTRRSSTSRSRPSAPTSPVPPAAGSPGSSTPTPSSSARCSSPPGRLADARGRKRVFLAGPRALRGRARALCAAGARRCRSWSPRAPCRRSARRCSCPPRWRCCCRSSRARRARRRVGLWGAAGGVAAATGPSLGALLVEGPGWRWVFYVNLPFCAVACWCGRRHPARSPGADRPYAPTWSVSCW